MCTWWGCVWGRGEGLEARAGAALGGGEEGAESTIGVLHEARGNVGKDAMEGCIQ